jgi:hypothetical protein
MDLSSGDEFKSIRVLAAALTLMAFGAGKIPHFCIISWSGFIPVFLQYGWSCYGDEL